MTFIKPEDIKEYVSKNPKGIAGESQELSEMVNYFAELIVRECIDYLESETNRLTELAFTEQNADYKENFTLCAEKCLDNIQGIKDHFGIES
jgi:hypothetical protein